jgi:hypothetical protein
MLGPGELQPRALPGESYQAALTPGMVSAIFGPLVPAAMLAASGFVQPAGETGWWIPSGRVNTECSRGSGDAVAQREGGADWGEAASGGCHVWAAM